jgi:initiation factor 1A
MVKNVTGGNKHKGQARKFANNSKQISNKLRVVIEEGEVYAQVIKMLGNGMCHVTCLDRITRLCIIRGKFRGRGKRDNTLKNGTWVLVGIREWDAEKTGNDKDLQKCDLLEVYSDLDVDRLKKMVDCDWSCFIENDAMFTNTKAKDDISFEDENSEEYKKLMEEEIMTSNKVKTISLKINNYVNDTNDGNDEINIDEI